MSERGHKRKRSLQDTSVDLSKMRMALNRLEAFKDVLDEIKETEEESHTISDHVIALQNILKGTKKRRLTFSAVTMDDLKKAGIRRRRLSFDSAKVTELTNGLSPNAEAEVADLHSRIKRIYARVNMDYEPGSRMILDAILLSLAEICSNNQRGVAILPEMVIAPGDGVQISHPTSGYELWLSGKVDYAVIEYKDVSDYKDRLLAPGGPRGDALAISQGRIFLVKAKRQKREDLVDYIPEAVSQAIALMKSAHLTEVRFCLSDGQSWIFFILKLDLENGTMTYCESAIRNISKDILANSDMPLREIVQLVCEWLRPTMIDLFNLE